ncbi:MAG: IctB family putative bicarbonate transporter [Cyanobacteria bacterium P01_A01_bin.135]
MIQLQPRSIWQHLTLSSLADDLGRWQGEYVTRPSGLLTSWRATNWLLRQADWLALGLVMLLYSIAPFTSTTLIGLVLLACSALWLLLLLRERIPLSPVHLVVLAYWAIATVATAFSPVRAAAADGWVKLTLYLMLFALLARLMRAPRFRNWTITAYLLTALVVAVGGLRQWFFGANALATWVDPDSSLAGTTRVYSYLGNPNLLAGYLIPAVLLAAAAVVAWRGLGKLLAATIALVTAACLVLTFSRGGWIGFVAGGFVFLGLLVQGWTQRLPPPWRRWTLPGMLAIAAAGLAVAVSTVAPLRDRVGSIFSGRADSSNNFRINVWTAVIDMIKARPILGIGPGNDAFNQVYPFYQEPGYTALSAYSVFLEIPVETGVIGLICFVWLLLVTFSYGWRHLQRLRDKEAIASVWLVAAMAAMVGMLAHGLVDTVWYRPQVSILWWLLLALIASFEAKSAEGDRA